MKAKNISRYTYQKTAFQGWRLCISRSGNVFTRYFSDRQYKDCRSSFRAAITLRNRILAELKKPGADPSRVLSRERWTDA